MTRLFFSAHFATLALASAFYFCAALPAHAEGPLAPHPTSQTETQPEAKSVEQLELAILDHPRSFTLHYKLGKAMMDAGRFRKAEENFLACTLIDPKSNAGRFGMAQVYEHTGKFADAVLVYKQILNRPQVLDIDRFRVEAAMKRLNYYRSLGDANSPDYIFAREFSDGHGWNKTAFPLKVAIWSDPELKELKQPFYNDIVRAFERWRVASGGKTTFKIVNDQRSADIVCKLVRVMRGTKNSGLGGKLGETNLQWDDKSDDIVKWSRIEIFWDDSYTLPKLEACVLHEVGHALGLNHSSNPHDIMFPVAQPPYAAILSDRDKNTLKTIYAN
ncbi:hypothetical protein BH11CYA1_BH11CYA1_30420 [soil metagenome]